MEDASVHDLAPITALGGTAPRIDTVAGATLTEVPSVALASVTTRLGKEKPAATALKKLIGADAPAPRHFASGTLTAFWMGPDQVMLEAPFDTHEDLAVQAKAVVQDSASVTEQTDGWTRFDLSGTGLLAVMELLCPINAPAMPVGGAERTSIHHLGCFVLRRAEDHFSIYGPRASAGSLHHALHTAMVSAL